QLSGWIPSVARFIETNTATPGTPCTSPCAFSLIMALRTTIVETWCVRHNCDVDGNLSPCFSWPELIWSWISFANAIHLGATTAGLRREQIDASITGYPQVARDGRDRPSYRRCNAQPGAHGPAE